MVHQRVRCGVTGIIQAAYQCSAGQARRVKKVAEMHSHPARTSPRAELERLTGFKQTKRLPPTRLGPQMTQFFKRSVQKQQGKLARIAECWTQLVPESLSKNCSLESMQRGVLTVLVDNASQLYELKQLLLSGLDKQLLLVCQSTGLRKISLRPGRWYEGDDGTSRPQFG